MNHFGWDAEETLRLFLMPCQIHVKWKYEFGSHRWEFIFFSFFTQKNIAVMYSIQPPNTVQQFLSTFFFRWSLHWIIFIQSSFRLACVSMCAWLLRLIHVYVRMCVYTYLRTNIRTNPEKLLSLLLLLLLLCFSVNWQQIVSSQLHVEDHFAPNCWLLSVES